MKLFLVIFICGSLAGPGRPVVDVYESLEEARYEVCHVYSRVGDQYCTKGYDVYVADLEKGTIEKIALPCRKEENDDDPGWGADD